MPAKHLRKIARRAGIASAARGLFANGWSARAACSRTSLFALASASTNTGMETSEDALGWVLSNTAAQVARTVERRANGTNHGRQPSHGGLQREVYAGPRAARLFGGILLNQITKSLPRCRPRWRMISLSRATRVILAETNDSPGPTPITPEPANGPGISLARSRMKPTIRRTDRSWPGHGRSFVSQCFAAWSAVIPIFDLSSRTCFKYCFRRSCVGTPPRPRNRPEPGNKMSRPRGTPWEAPRRNRRPSIAHGSR
jgi:hypothetical protein